MRRHSSPHLLLFRVAMVAVISLPLAGVAAEAPPPTAARDTAKEIAKLGGDPSAFLTRPLTLQIPQSRGGTRAVTRTVEQWLIGIPRGSATGPHGTPETVAGDLFHSYTNTRQGNALAYTVTTSSRVPVTPGFTVAGNEPGSTPLFVAGGSWMNVKSTFYAYGIHTSGTTRNGSNLDTAGGPNGFPVVLPFVHSTERQDAKIDFAGQLVFLTQNQTCTDGVCVALGFFLGSGTAIFDTDSVSLPVV